MVSPRLVRIASVRSDALVFQALAKLHFQPEDRRCYDNATTISMRMPQLDYVEGELWFPDDQVSMPHAWNAFRGTHFDVTVEVFKGLQPHIEYYAILQAPIRTLISEGLDPNVEGCLMPQWINKKQGRSILFPDPDFEFYSS